MNCSNRIICPVTGNLRCHISEGFRSDTIDGSEVTGSVVSGRDSYVYTGEIQASDIPSSIQVLKNGTEATPPARCCPRRSSIRKPS